MRRDAEGIAFGSISALAVVVAALGLALLPLLTSGVVARVANDAGLATRTGLPQERALDAAEMVRAYVTTPSPRRLPLAFYGRDAFDARAAEHLDDVRGVIGGAVAATVLAMAALVGAAVLARRRGRVADLASGVRAAGIALPVVLLASAVFAAVAFDAAFTLFHRLFFTGDSWRFATDDLLVLLFPERFWAIAGAVWALLAGALAAGAGALGAHLRSTSR